MLSFPSTLNTGGSQTSLPSATPRGISELLGSMGKQFLNSATNRVLGGVLSFFSGGRTEGPPDTSRIKYDVDVDENISILKPLAWNNSSTLNIYNPRSIPTNGWYENSLIFNPDIYSIMNTYRYVYLDKSIVAMDILKPLSDDNSKDKNKKETQMAAFEWNGGELSPSLFNPYYGVQRIGPTRNTPLIDSDRILSETTDFDTDFTDCSISKLCELSKQPESELGQARYKYSDFMYCKDLGMPNNRLITLRRFATPVGDMIFGKAATGPGEDNVYSTPGDVGRLLGYFDTDDNKLEDILNYSFNASWKDVKGEWQGLASKEDNNSSALGMLLNTMSNNYRENYNKSLAGGNSLLDYFLGAGKFKSKPNWYEPGDVLAHYDEHKIYDPIDTVRDTHLYEGILKFNHEFTLTFNYTLRSYDNINPKAAMLDLLANITGVCYKRGHFWGGRSQILGAQPNLAGWDMANKFIDNGFDKLGGIFSSLANGQINFSSWMGELSNMVGQVASAVKDLAQTAKNMANKAKDGDTSGAAQEAKDAIPENVKKVIKNTASMVRGAVKNKLGRPQMYLFNSILTGADVGLWHLTIGNPRNPIAVMGNLIMTDAKVQQYGPLGQDDFPTGLKVTVTLKHARSRDMVDIQKMYTRGVMAIYQSMNTPAKLSGGEDNKSSGGWANHLSSTPEGIMYAGDFNEQRIKRNCEELR